MPIGDEILQPGMKGLTTGQILKRELGLANFKTVWIRKIIDLALNVYIVYFNSRYPTSYLSISKIKNLDTVTIKRLKQSGLSYKHIDYKYTPPIPLEDFNAKIQSNSMLMRIDVVGEWFADKDLYEGINLEYFSDKKIMLG
jgi:hypothetical protein